MQEELSKLIEGLSDVERGRRAGQHWGNGAQARRQPRRFSHPLAGIQLGVQGHEEQARLAAEGWLNAGPSANLPRLRPQDGSWSALCYSYPERANGAMPWLANYVTLGSLIQPEEWRRAAVLLEWQAFLGLPVTIFVPSNGALTKEARRGAQRRTVIGNDFRGMYLNEPVKVPAGVPELGISFS